MNTTTATKTAPNEVLIEILENRAKRDALRVGGNADELELVTAVVNELRERVRRYEETADAVRKAAQALNE